MAERYGIVRPVAVAWNGEMKRIFSISITDSQDSSLGILFRWTDICCVCRVHDAVADFSLTLSATLGRAFMLEGHAFKRCYRAQCAVTNIVQRGTVGLCLCTCREITVMFGIIGHERVPLCELSSGDDHSSPDRL